VNQDGNVTVEDILLIIGAFSNTCSWNSGEATKFSFYALFDWL